MFFINDREKMLVSVVGSVRKFFFCADGEMIDSFEILCMLEDDAAGCLETVHRVARQFGMDKERSSFNEEGYYAYQDAISALDLLINWESMEKESGTLKSFRDVADTIGSTIEGKIAKGDTDISDLRSFCDAWNRYATNFCPFSFDVWHNHDYETGRITGIGFNDECYYLQ